jgi:hypothetical protein
MRPTTKSLPRQDVLSLLDILVVLLGELTADQLSPDLTTHVMRRLVKDRLLAEEASVGELRAVVADLVERLRFALGEYASYPEPLLRGTTYIVSIPNEEAARACRDRLTDWGALALDVTEGADRTGWEVRASFPDLIPDPSYEQRVVQLQELAVQHGGRYEGSEF